MSQRLGRTSRQPARLAEVDASLLYSAGPARAAKRIAVRGLAWGNCTAVRSCQVPPRASAAKRALSNVRYPPASEIVRSASSLGQWRGSALSTRHKQTLVTGSVPALTSLSHASWWYCTIPWSTWAEEDYCTLTSAIAYRAALYFSRVALGSRRNSYSARSSSPRLYRLPWWLSRAAPGSTVGVL